MTKYLLVLLVVAVGFLLLKRQFQGKRKEKESRYTRGDDLRTLRETEPMMRCTHCGIFMPRSAAVHIQGRYYCSSEHAKASEEASVRGSDDKHNKKS